MKKNKEQPSDHSVFEGPINSSSADNNWLMHELEYWEAAYGRIMQEYLIATNSHNDWKQAHENVVAQIGQWEAWYKSLERDRDLYKQWDEDKRKEIEKLNKLITVIYKTIDIWKTDHTKLEEKIKQWEVWYKSLEKDRNLYKQWDEDKRKEIDRLNKLITEIRQTKDIWETNHTKLEDKIKQWEMWYKSLEKDRDLYKQWDEDKRTEIDKLNKYISEFQNARQFWQEEHAKVVALVEQRSEELKKMKIHWETDNKKLTDQVQQWVSWFQDMQNNRDLYKQWNEDKRVEIDRLQSTIQDLRALVAALLDHPLYYFASFLRKKFNRKNKLKINSFNE